MRTMVVAPSKLKEARESAGISQRDASAHLDVTERSLRAWEKGESRIPADHAASLARLYGVDDLWSLFTHEPEAARASTAHG